MVWATASPRAVMEFKQSLAQRIIIAFALMSALVAGTFAMGIVATVHLVEEKLISAGLGGDLQRLLLMDNVADWNHRPEPDQLFYYSGGRGDFALPKDLRHLDPGFHEVFRDQLSYHAMVEVVDGRLLRKSPAMPPTLRSMPVVPVSRLMMGARWITQLLA